MKTSNEKKTAIKHSLSKTRERRTNQDCKVYELKIDWSALNIIQKTFIKKIFIEAKWLYNFILSQENIFDKEYSKLKEVAVKKAEVFETRKLECLSSQMKQSLQEKIFKSIKGLSVLKKKNKKVGRLKFKSEINSIELKQFEVTWDFKNSGIRVQGLKKFMKVKGLKQIPNGSEFANAFIIKKPSGYYFHITTYQPKIKKVKTGKEIGIDFGIKDMLVTSNGEKINCNITESKRLKQLQMWLSKKVKGSKNWWKTKNKIRLEYERIDNKKKDKVNKIINSLTGRYDVIHIQDENISGWKKWFGKQVQHSILGAIKTRLKNLESTQVVNRWEPTTKLCYACGKKNKIGLDERTYRCSCGLEEDRDIKAAKTILLIGQKQANTLVENRRTTVEEAVNTVLNFIQSSKSFPMKQEAYGL